MSQPAENFPSKCYYQAVDTIDISLLEQLHIRPDELYASVGNIISLAKALYAERDAAVISLPFSHTVEAQALGADIQPADETAGPRAGQYVLQNPGQIEMTDLVAEPQVANLLEACQLLATDGYQVAYQISGPISIFSCLMDLAVVFKVWRKQPELMAKIFDNLRQMLLSYAEAACRSQAAYLSYADPAGNADIFRVPGVIRYIRKGICSHLRITERPVHHRDKLRPGDLPVRIQIARCIAPHDAPFHNLFQIGLHPISGLCRRGHCRQKPKAECRGQRKRCHSSGNSALPILPFGCLLGHLSSSISPFPAPERLGRSSS